jgi:dolichol-phosphate mannosyltransferase
LRLTLILPTYNEAENLPDILAAVFALPLPDLRVLVVDDNSPDGTGQIAKDLAQTYAGRLDIHERTGKLGLGTAYLEGFRLALDAGAQAVAQMDSDFSHPPEKLVELHELLSHCDVAVGSRYVAGGRLDERWPLWRRLLSAFGNAYARTILSLPLGDVTGGFRMWRRETLEALPLERVRSNGYVFQVEMAYLAHRLGYTIREIPIYFADRRWGKSKMSLSIQMEAALRVWMVLFAYRDLAPSAEPQRARPVGRQ